MPLKVRRLPQAVDDLHEIWLQIALDSQRAADRFAELVYAAEDMLADYPALGEARPDLASGLRKWRVWKYLLLYRVDEDAVTIVRILHGARDLSGALDD